MHASWTSQPYDEDTSEAYGYVIIEQEKVENKSNEKAKAKSVKKNCLDKKCRNKAEKSKQKCKNKANKQKSKTRQTLLKNLIKLERRPSCERTHGKQIESRVGKL